MRDSMKNEAPRIQSKLREHFVSVPSAIYKASGIIINGRRIKSLLFSTDIAIIANCNADAIIAVYPFTPTVEIMQSIVQIAKRPVFAGVGGGTTGGPRVKNIALDAELHGAQAIVLNAPTKTEVILAVKDEVDIPIVLTIASLKEDIVTRVNTTKPDIINVSGGIHTTELVKKIRQYYPDIALIATGGPSEQTIEEVIAAGANAVTYTPPTNGDLFKELMEKYRAMY